MLTALSFGALACLAVGLTPAGGPVPEAHAAPTTSLENPLTADFICSSCHGYANNMAAADLPPHDPFAYFGTLMANAARDPVFWGGVALAAQDHPDETEDCIRCHAPRAFLEGRGDATTVDELTPLDFNSVSCGLCHRSMDDGETPPGNARYVLDDVLVDGEVVRRGPRAYDDPEGSPEPPHPYIQDVEFLPSSRMCGTCHDVTTERERVDSRGVGLGVNFNEQRTYSEWLNSDFAEPGEGFQTCQDCHMKVVEVPAAGCQEHENLGYFYDDHRRHLIMGANSQALRIIQTNSPGANFSAINTVLEYVEEFASEAATLEVVFPEAVDLGAGIDTLPVRVINETGHKLPTGYSEGRVMWLEVTASYGDEVVWSSGLWDGAALEDDAQLRTYEGVAERWSDGTKNHLLLNDYWREDTRIPPRGLSPSLETDPVGDRYALLPDDTWPNYDDHNYVFEPTSVVDQTPDEQDDDQLELRVRLLYLINTQSYLDQLRDDNESNDAGQAVWDMYAEDGGPQPVELARAEVSVPLTGLDDPPAETSGEGEGDGDGDPTTGGDGDGDDPAETSGSGTGGGESETAGETGAAEDGSGCACGVGDDSRHRERGAAGLLLLALLGIRRRRRD